MSNVDIADEMFFPTDRADELIMALIEAEWLDPSDTCRLIVHDWSDHADDYIDVKLARSGKTYADGKPPRMIKLSKDERARLCAQFGWNGTVSHKKPQKATKSEVVRKPVPVPVPVPVPKATTNTCAAASATPAAPRLPISEPTKPTAVDLNGRAITLPMLKGAFLVAAGDCVKWADAYPGVNVLTELLQMEVWLDANPKNRKTNAGMNRFIVSWLSRAQNQARPAGGGNGGTNGNRSQQRSDGNKHALRESLSDAEIEAIARSTGGGATDFDQRGGLQNLLIPPGAIPS